jgi:hypothetical protein
MDHGKEISTKCCVVIGFLEHDDDKLATELLLGKQQHGIHKGLVMA